MKRIAAIAGALALAVWLGSCTDTPTGPGSSPAQESGEPGFSVYPPGFVLYAGTSYPGMVYSYDGSSWAAISGALGDAVLDIIEFGGDLYAAGFVDWYNGPGRIWRFDGFSWTPIWSGYRQVADLEVWHGDLYAGTGLSGGRLLRYDPVAGTFGEVGTVSGFLGIRAMYPWAATDVLVLGDFQYDTFGHWDGSVPTYDGYFGGSCVFDFAEFDGDLYAAVYGGTIRRLEPQPGFPYWWQGYSHMTGWTQHVWELEAFGGHLYWGNDRGIVGYVTSNTSSVEIWNSYTSFTQAITSMTVGGGQLFFGTGHEAGYVPWSPDPYDTNGTDVGTAQVWVYDGSSPPAPVQIFDADGGDTGGTNHAGVQVLYVPSTPPPPPNQQPAAILNGPYLGAAGTGIAVDGTGSSDPDGDALTYNWDFGDGNTGSGATTSHIFAEAGVYDVCLTVNDGTVDSDPACTLAVVYDPGAGFVTGGGWIESPAGAYVPDPALTGKASFGFVAKYKKGASTPDGNTEFQFQTAGLNFHSSAYDWLVVNRNDANAQFKGTGTVNGEGEYLFMIWAEDANPDMFRIKIWEEDVSGVEYPVYDNGFGQAILGGSIIVHTK